MSSTDSIEASISFTDRATHLDLDGILRAKEAGTHWFGRRDVAHLCIGPVTVWIEPTPDGRTNVGLYRQFLNRKQRSELKRMSDRVLEFAAKHGVEKQILGKNGSDPQVDRN